MKYAVISDIHGNAEALRSVLSDIREKEVDVIICLGDIVGYYPEPEECIKLIRDNAAYSVAGNHDYAAIGNIDTRNFTYHAYEAMEWTRLNLSDESRDYIASLPLSIELDSMVFTHSSPANPEQFTYIFPNSEEAIKDAFSSMVQKIVFVGHTHWPFIMMQEEPGIICGIKEKEVDIDPESYYLINVGSVGQPRNRKPESTYAFYDTEEQYLSLVSVEYDYPVTQQKTREAGLPVFLAERLESGR